MQEIIEELGVEPERLRPFDKTRLVYKASERV